MKVVIIGRHGVGKHYLATLLMEKGFSEAISAKKEQMECNDFCIATTPEELKTLLGDMPDTAFLVVHVTELEDGTAKSIAKRDGKDLETLWDAEDEEFTLFESVPLTSEEHPFINRDVCVVEAVNNFDPGCMQYYADIIENEWILQRNLTKIIQKCRDADILYTDRDDPVKVLLYRKDKKPEPLSCELFAQEIRGSDEGIAILMRQFLSMSVRDFR